MCIILFMDMPAPSPSPLRRRLFAGLLGIFALGAPASIRSQQAPAGEAGAREATRALRFSDESSVTWVLVPVVVRRSSRLVSRLEADDFRLWVDEQPVSIGSFETGSTVPIRLIYLQDLSGSMANGGKLEASQRALRLFLEQTASGDELALVTFSSGLTRLDVPFTGHPARLEEALVTWQAHGTTALYDAVAGLPEIRSGERALRRAAVVVTDGGDNASAVEPVRAREIVRRAELPTYVLELRSHRPPRDTAAVSEQISASQLLRRLAKATGAQYHTVDAGAVVPEPKKDRLKAACQAISAELRHQYVLGFQTRNTGSPTFRRIRIEVAGNVGGFTFSHRRGYVGLPPFDS